MQNDLISRSALKKDLLDRSFFPAIVKAALENAPAADAVPIEMLGKWGKLLLPYKGDPRGPVGRMGDGHLEEEALYWGVVTDADGGRWVPVQEAVLLELIEKEKANGRESLRPKGRWEIHCRTTYDSWTRETDEEFYLECSECKRQVWDVDYMAVQNDDIQKLIEKYPYCHCGCKMEG